MSIFLIDNIPSLGVNLGVEDSVGSIEVMRAGRPLVAILKFICSVPTTDSTPYKSNGIRFLQVRGHEREKIRRLFDSRATLTRFNPEVPFYMFFRDR